MLVPMLLPLALLAWSVVANLVIGEHLYVTRNLLLCVVLVAVAFASGSDWSELGFGRETVASGLRWGLGGIAVVVVVVTIGILVRDLIPLVDTLLGDRRADIRAVMPRLSHGRCNPVKRAPCRGGWLLRLRYRL
jgi:hypothetical protein